MSFNRDDIAAINSSHPDHIFLNAFNYAAIGMALVGLDGKLLRVNRSLCHFLGYSDEELTNLTFQDITYTDDLDANLMVMQKLLTGEINSYQLEKRYIHKAGHLVWALLSVSLIRDDQGEALFLISQIENINERKVTEQALHVSEERLSLVIRGMGVGLWDWHVPSGEFVLNERWAEMIGYTLEELGPTNFHTWDPFVHPDDLKRAAEAMELHFAGQREYYEVEVRLRHKAGHWIWVLDRGKVVEWDAAGKPLRVTGTHLDITERKRVEAERENMIVQLQQALDEVKTLQGILPICSYCKQVRTDENYWQAVETYVSQLTGAEFSHSICPDCYDKHVRQQLESLRLRKASDAK
jgi:PAS domain S-box-containing protein